MADIDKIKAGLDTRLRNFKRKFGVEFLRRVKERTPVRTGELQKSWGFTEKATDIEIYNVAEYASFVEYGTPRMEPVGMMRATIAEIDQITEVAIAEANKK